MKIPAFLILFFTTLRVFCADEEGYASWYAGKFQGRITANGEIFNTDKLTAAHKTLPFGTIVRVTNIENGQYVDVRINDRGPFVEGRIIDLSRAAAEKIGMTRSGVAYVSLDILSVPKILVTIQVGAYSQESNAAAVRTQLTAAGFEAVIEPSGKGIYRVVLKDLEKSEAEAVLSGIQAAGYPSAFIRRSK